MQSTDRPQVLDLIEMLQRFDPKARVCGREFEILDVQKGDDCLVYLEIDSNVSERATELEDWETRLIEMAKTHPEKLAKFILEGEE